MTKNKGKVTSEIKVDLPKEEAKPEHRPVSEIQSEYTGLCARAGNLQYQIVTLSKDLEQLNSKLRDLNFEAAASQAVNPPSSGAV